ncbi:TPA: hypothetical protein ACW0I5_002695 [Escherichia coli]
MSTSAKPSFLLSLDNPDCCRIFAGTVTQLELTGCRRAPAVGDIIKVRWLFLGTVAQSFLVEVAGVELVYPAVRGAYLVELRWPKSSCDGLPARPRLATPPAPLQLPASASAVIDCYRRELQEKKAVKFRSSIAAAWRKAELLQRMNHSITRTT